MLNRLKAKVNKMISGSKKKEETPAPPITTVKPDEYSSPSLKELLQSTDTIASTGQSQASSIPLSMVESGMTSVASSDMTRERTGSSALTVDGLFNEHRAYALPPIIGFFESALRTMAQQANRETEIMELWSQVIAGKNTDNQHLRQHVWSFQDRLGSKTADNAVVEEIYQLACDKPSNKSLNIVGIIQQKNLSFNKANVAEPNNDVPENKQDNAAGQSRLGCCSCLFLRRNRNHTNNKQYLAQQVNAAPSSARPSN